uniref:C2H2-type domain-containing protein n=1 Tax=Pogona vitticeps TaxID=103695 RepID=A0A6J0SYE1_9SAUR
MKSCKCTECGKSFKEKNAFVKHLKIHSGERPYICLICGKNFTKKSSLVIHQRIHSRSKPFACNDCGKTFGQKSNLLIHNKTHILKKVNNSKSLTCVSKHPDRSERQRAEKSYRCPECKKTFVLHKNLIKHQKTHARVMPQSPEMVGLPVQQKTEDCSGLILQELRKMRENVDMLLLNQQSQLHVLQEIQKQLGILIPGNYLINSNVYSLGRLVAQQAAAMGSTSFPLLLHPSNLLPESARPFSSHASS